MKRCLLNAAMGTGWFVRGQERLNQSLDKVGFTGGRLFYSGSNYPPGCPTHQVSPYAFKIYAFIEAIKAGYESILWIDSSCWAIKPLDEIFEKIEEDGHLILENRQKHDTYHPDKITSWTTGQFCSDDALEKLGLDREEALKMRHVVGGCIGLNTKSARSMEFLRLWKEFADDGVTFLGKSGSKDPRVLGHRHDQTVASALALRLDMFPWFWFGKYFDYNFLHKVNRNPDPTVTFLCEGM